jgi:eukaryotic-like serine/threonine-protein kinase
MLENRWQQIEEIFNRAAVLPVAERQTFVENICEEDEELCREILLLISSDNLETSFLDEPVFSLGVQLLDNDFLDLLKAENFASYKLKKLLGRGGMGAVYLAQDTRLERAVAVKVLPASLSGNKDAVSRFRQEARAASNVAHQNIAHIYEFGEANGRLFLAMEYVRGRTLRELIKENSINQTQALDFALQIARALQAAHRNGIVHRDIKPENVIVAEDGMIKVLDFGLAKLTGTSEEFNQTDSLETTPGIILGTTAYMSPEQVRGAAVDYTSDLWSLGVILYEMLWQNRPFTGATPSDVRAAILRDEPSYENATPLLEEIFRKTLRKEKSERYNTVAALIEDLEKLKALDASNLKNFSTSKKSSPDLQLFNTSPALIGIGSILILLFLGGIVFFLYPQPKNTSHVIQANRLTNNGKAKYATISTDGELLAYSLEELAGRAIYLLTRNQRTKEFDGQPKLLVAATKNIVSQLAFSPDKKFLYYKMREPDKNIGSLYRIALSNENQSEKILDDLQGAPSFSPDGKQFVFFRLSRDNSREEVIIANTENGAEERVLFRRTRPDFIPDTAQPVWSPDGKTILVAGGTYGEDAESYNIYAIQVSDGTAKAILGDSWGEIWATSWIENGNAFVFAGHQEKLADNNQLWRASFPEGEVTRLTNDYNDYFTVFSAEVEDVQTEVITLILQRAAQIYRANLDDAAGSAATLTAEGDSGYGISVSASGQIFYGSTKAGNPDIWVMEADGSNQRQLTSDNKLDSQPLVSKNGEFVIFGSYRSGSESLWKMNLDGTNQVLLTPNISRDSLAVSPDGKAIYFRSSAKGAEAVWRVSPDGGEPEKFAAGNYKSVAVSPDGKLLAATVQSEGEEDNQLAILSIENPSVPLRVFKLIEGAEPLEKIRFLPDGKSIVYIAVQKGVGNLWAQPIEGKTPPKPLTDFKTLHLYSFDFTRDGKQLYCSRGELNSHVVRLRLEKAD